VILHISLQLPFTKFVLTNAGYLQDQQMYFPRIRTVGFTLADHNTGPFHLEIDYIKLVMFMYQPKHFKYHYQSKAWLFCQSVTNGLHRKVSFNSVLRFSSLNCTSVYCHKNGNLASSTVSQLFEASANSPFRSSMFNVRPLNRGKVRVDLLWDKLYYFPNLNYHFHSPF